MFMEKEKYYTWKREQTAHTHTCSICKNLAIRESGLGMDYISCTQFLKNRIKSFLAQRNLYQTRAFPTFEFIKKQNQKDPEVTMQYMCSRFVRNDSLLYLVFCPTLGQRLCLGLRITCSFCSFCSQGSVIWWIRCIELQPHQMPLKTQANRGHHISLPDPDEAWHLYWEQKCQYKVKGFEMAL